MDLLILGCSGSSGVPLIGCDCRVCKSSHPRNQRTRTSCLLRSEKGNLLVDIGPDFRFQALRESIPTHGPRSIHAVFLTHLHYDHIAGLDEIRLFNFHQKKPMPLLLSATHKEALYRRLPYIFVDQSAAASSKNSKAPIKKNYTPSMRTTLFTPSSKAPISAEFEGFDLKLVQYYQGEMEVTGFIAGDLAYLPDIKDYPHWLQSALLEEEVQTLIIGAHSFEKSPLQLSVDEAASFGVGCGAKEIILTHMSHGIDYEKAAIPEYVSLAYDGRVIPIKE